MKWSELRLANPTPEAVVELHVNQVLSTLEEKLELEAAEEKQKREQQHKVSLEKERIAAEKEAKKEAARQQKRIREAEKKQQKQVRIYVGAHTAGW